MYMLFFFAFSCNFRFVRTASNKSYTKQQAESEIAVNEMLEKNNKNVNELKNSSFFTGCTDIKIDTKIVNCMQSTRKNYINMQDDRSKGNNNSIAVSDNNLAEMSYHDSSGQSQMTHLISGGNETKPKEEAKKNESHQDLKHFVLPDRFSDKEKSIIKYLKFQIKKYNIELLKKPCFQKTLSLIKTFNYDAVTTLINSAIEEFEKFKTIDIYRQIKEYEKNNHKSLDFQSINFQFTEEELEDTFTKVKVKFETKSGSEDSLDCYFKQNEYGGDNYAQNLNSISNEDYLKLVCDCTKQKHKIFIITAVKPSDDDSGKRARRRRRHYDDDIAEIYSSWGDVNRFMLDNYRGKIFYTKDYKYIFCGENCQLKNELKYDIIKERKNDERDMRSVRESYEKSFSKNTEMNQFCSTITGVNKSDITALKTELKALFNQNEKIYIDEFFTENFYTEIFLNKILLIDKLCDLVDILNMLTTISAKNQEINKDNFHQYKIYEEFKRYFNWPTEKTNKKLSDWQASAYYYFILVQAKNDIEKILSNKKKLMERPENFLTFEVKTEIVKKFKNLSIETKKRC